MAKTNKTAQKTEETAKAVEVDQKEENGPEANGSDRTPEPSPQRTHSQIVTDSTYLLSSVVENHYLSPDAYSKPSDYNQLMRKIENLKSDILKFIK